MYQVVGIKRMGVFNKTRIRHFAYRMGWLNYADARLQIIDAHCYNQLTCCILKNSQMHDKSYD